MVAGLGGDTGKTLVSLGLGRALTRRGRRVVAFKKGPDFIDASWLGAATWSVAHNLDTFLMTQEAIERSLSDAAKAGDMALLEGNRGLFDGFDVEGSHSSAVLAKRVAAPVLLVMSAAKVTRTLAAMALGCQRLDPELGLGGVILNRVGSSRQESLIREAITQVTGLPVLGAIPRLDLPGLPSRHLGLLPPAEHPDVEQVLEALARVVDEYVDVAAIVRIAETAPPLAAHPRAETVDAPVPPKGLRIGVLRDRAFSFYYPENLAALEAAGAELVPVSPLDDADLPHLDALYAGGGFPEQYLESLSANAALRAALKAAISDGLPVWAECGGLMYLSEAVIRGGRAYPMVGALPVRVSHTDRPQGHGYVEARVDHANPFLRMGTRLRGHEFHYSRVEESRTAVPTALALERGTGLGGGRDGLLSGQVLASYTHLHALGAPEWAPALVNAARVGAWVTDRSN
jgi:cobyrinic acid a,c-diamide synthase